MGGSAFIVALLGAESTGKTTLALALQRALAERGHRAVAVAEYLREFCEQHARTPRRDEQAAIAAEQTRRIDEAAAECDIVVADTSALMIAVYSDQVFGDTSLYASAENAHRRSDLTLMTALDLPWRADGLQRDGPQVREPVDAKIRASLGRLGGSYAVVCGSGAARLGAALDSVLGALQRPAIKPRTAWSAHCERCGDAACERHALLPRR